MAPNPRPRRRSLLIAKLEADQSGSPQQAILDEIRRVILDGGVPPGSAIPVNEVAELFGVSPIPVREALKTLIGEGLVDHQANGGYRVERLTIAELQEMYVVRGVLENAALAAAVAAATDLDDQRAMTAHAALGRVVAGQDRQSYHRESRRFHLALVNPCPMRRLVQMFESAWNITEPFQPMNYITDTDRAALHADHQQMLTAFMSRDTGTLIAVAEAHHRHLAAAIAALPAESGIFTRSR